jgi:hypothetical protein
VNKLSAAKEFEMKREIVTTLSWDFARSFYAGMTANIKGMVTNIPPPEGEKTAKHVYITTLSISSELGNAKQILWGFVNIKFDRSVFAQNSDSSKRLSDILQNLKQEKLIGGSAFTDSTCGMSFSLASNGMTFCDEAMLRGIAIFTEFGGKKQNITFPKITQETYHKDNSGRRVTYGEVLGRKHGLRPY